MDGEQIENAFVLLVAVVLAAPPVVLGWLVYAHAVKPAIELFAALRELDESDE